MGLVRALIVSDLRIYREGVSAALRADPGIEVVGVAAHTNEARAVEVERAVELVANSARGKAKILETNL